MRNTITATLVALLLTTACPAQDKADKTILLKIDVPKLKFEPLKPQITFTSPNIASPGINNFKLPEPLKLDYKISAMSDSLKAMPEINASFKPTPTAQRYDFGLNPYGRDWSAGGVITSIGELKLTGSGGRTSMPGLGNMASGTLALTGTVDEKLTLTGGVSGMKYHFDRSTWNDYGMFGRASYKLSDRLSLNAFGQYYFDQRYHSIPSMGYMQSANFGGTLGIKVSDKVSLDVGVQRYYDPYSGTWRTLPVVAPTINLFGQPVSFDVGGLIYQLARALLDKHRGSSYSMPQGGGSYGAGSGSGGGAFNMPARAMVPNFKGVH